MNGVTAPLPPAAHAQQLFRAMLEAMARPGLAVALPGATDGRQGSLAVAATLVDVETTFAIVGDARAEPEEEIRIRTGCRLTDVSEADFACLIGPGAAAALRKLPRGTLLDPSFGATALWAPSPRAPGRATVALSGPGVDGTRTLELRFDDGDMLEALNESRAGYPCGVDVAIFPGDGTVIGLPRSTRIEVG